MNNLSEKRSVLLTLSHDLGAEHRQLAILGEGNTSAKLSDETFLIKASGSNLGTLTENDVTECRFAPVLALLDRTGSNYPGDQEIEDEIFGCRVDSSAKKPSIESLFHAYLLTLPGVNFVGHVHSLAVNQIICTERARDFAERRLFPDEIVCCGGASVLVPYADPGLKLAQMIRHGCVKYIEQYGVTPRVILLENHGIITLGASSNAVTAAMFMADKAARIFIGSLIVGEPRFLGPEVVDRIANRIDEHHRQRALKL